MNESQTKWWSTEVGKAREGVKKMFGEGVQKPFTSLVNQLVVHPHSSSAPYLYGKPRHWEADSVRRGCSGCAVPFSLFVRRHHCRNCGSLFCSNCTAERIKVVGYDNEERVCATCYDNVRSDIIFMNKHGGIDNDIIRWQLLIVRIREGKSNNGEIISRIYDGVPDSLRAELWNSLYSITKTKTNSLISYSSLLKPNEQYAEKIQLDVTRTFPESSLIQSPLGQSVLSNLLTALTAFYPSQGYAQHSAYVAGLVLIVMGCDREEDAFWILAQLFDKTKGPLAPGRVEAAVDYVRETLEGSHPLLAQHLAQQQITLDVFVHRWFSTLFAYDVPMAPESSSSSSSPSLTSSSPGVVAVVWDLLLACGPLFAPSLALAILDHASASLQQLDANGVVQYFNHLPPSLFSSHSTLLDDAFSHWCNICKR